MWLTTRLTSNPTLSGKRVNTIPEITDMTHQFHAVRVVSWIVSVELKLRS